MRGRASREGLGEIASRCEISIVEGSEWIFRCPHSRCDAQRVTPRSPPNHVLAGASRRLRAFRGRRRAVAREVRGVFLSWTMRAIPKAALTSRIGALTEDELAELELATDEALGRVDPT